MNGFGPPLYIIRGMVDWKTTQLIQINTIYFICFVLHRSRSRSNLDSLAFFLNPKSSFLFDSTSSRDVSGGLPTPGHPLELSSLTGPSWGRVLGFYEEGDDYVSSRTV
jgi:hypothetical protein